MVDAPRSPETRDVSPRALLAFGGGLVVFVALALGVIAVIFDTAEHWPPPGASATGNAESPALQLAPAQDLASGQRREIRELSQAGWIDREAGIAQIPIEDAMRIVAERGLPDWQPRADDAGDECALLRLQVPRSPQAERCRTQAPGVTERKP